MDDKKQQKRNRTLRSERRRAQEREFERLYRESYGMVYNYVRYRMGDDPAVEDVVADAYLRAARSFSRFNPARAKFSTWVVRIASNCMATHWRREHPTTPLEDVPELRFSQSDATAEVADRDLVDRLLATLSAGERNLVVMKYREGYRNVDIAAELGMNASTVSTKLAKALAKMRDAMDELS